MTIRTFKVTTLIILCCYVFPVAAFGNEANLKEHILITGTWGHKDGQFGREDLGKTELGYALDFRIYKNRIYILDTINNRIQVFDLDGKFVNKIMLDFDWLKQGIAWEFALLKEHFYLLVAKSPYYSPLNVDNIYKFASTGRLLKKFGSEQIDKSKEEYFYKLRGAEQKENIICGVGGASKIAVYDFDGNFIKYLMNVKNFIIDNRGEVVPSDFSWIDKKGNYYRIKSKTSRKKNFAITTSIQIYNPDYNTKINYEIFGDVTKKDRTGAIKNSGSFTEASFVDPEGIIYHLIAVNDGVILRKIEWKRE